MRTESLDHLAARQEALFTRDQALGRGLTARQLEHGCALGRWLRMYRSVYRMAGAPSTEVQSLLAAVLACGPGALASHRGASWLWALTDDLVLDVSGPLQRSPGPAVQVHRPRAVKLRPVIRRGVPCTDPLRTMLDLAALGDEALLVTALDRAVSTRLFTAAAVGAELGRRAGKGVRGSALLRTCIEARLDVGGENPSGLESAMDRLILRYGVPLPERQYRLPGTRYRLDYAWPPARVLVEVDGYAYHSSLDAFGYDRERQNALVLAGWRVLRFTWAQVRDRPAWVAEQIRAALCVRLPA